MKTPVTKKQKRAPLSRRDQILARISEILKLGETKKN